MFPATPRPARAFKYETLDVPAPPLAPWALTPLPGDALLSFNIIAGLTSICQLRSSFTS
jgi:hypothetical protein